MNTTKDKVILVGIAGGTGSGKTSVARAMIEEFPKEDVAYIEQDSYYRDLKDVPLEERQKVNYDHPDAMDFDLMRKQVVKLLKREPVDVPVYDYESHTRSAKVLQFSGQHIIVLEGILSLYDKTLRDMMDIKIFVDTPDDLRILRRLKRDIKERGRDLDSVVTQYYKTVRPMHLQFIEPTKAHADIIVPEGASNLVAIDILKTKLKDLLNRG